MSDTVDVAKALVSLFRGIAKQKKQQKEEVSNRFREALTELEIYYGKLKHGVPIDPEVESHLARAWSAAARTAAPYDAEFSDACLSVSRYWADPPDHSMAAIDELISILKELHVEMRKVNQLFASR